jgi:hypothetical protein
VIGKESQMNISTSPESIFFSIFLAFGVLSVISLAGIAQISQSVVPVQSCGHLDATGPSLLKSEIGSNLSAVSFLLNWTNSSSSLEMTLISPTGQKIDSSAQPPVVYDKNVSMEYYVVPSPEPGTWTEQVKANSVPNKGEDYCLSTIFIMLQGSPENITSPEQLNASAPENTTSSEQLNASAPDQTPCPTCGK